MSFNIIRSFGFVCVRAVLQEAFHLFKRLMVNQLRLRLFTIFLIKRSERGCRTGPTVAKPKGSRSCAFPQNRAGSTMFEGNAMYLRVRSFCDSHLSMMRL